MTRIIFKKPFYTYLPNKKRSFLAMPIIIYNKWAKRARESFNKVKDPNIQLGRETGFINLIYY